MLSEAGLNQLTKTPATLVWPCEASGVVTSPFGTRTHPVTKAQTCHHGIDIRAPQGSQINAPFGGVVVAAWLDQETGGGTSIILEGKSGGHVWRVGFAHCSALLRNKGDRVRRGDFLALSGGTPGTPGAGRSTGPHIHLKMRVDGTEIDPLGPLVQWTGRPTDR